MEHNDVRTPGRVTVEWKAISCSGEIDGNGAGWIFCGDERREVLQDAVVPPRVGTGVKEVAAVVEYVVQRFLYAA